MECKNKNTLSFANEYDYERERKLFDVQEAIF